MVHPTPPSMLARLFGTRPARPREQEPADLGTAFGMELTLDQSDLPEPPGADDGPYAWLPKGRRTRPPG